MVNYLINMVREFVPSYDLTIVEFGNLMDKGSEARFTEAVMLSEKFTEALFRLVPPSLILALVQTDNKEKEVRHKIMQEHNCSELEAVYLIAKDIQKHREAFKN